MIAYKEKDSKIYFYEKVQGFEGFWAPLTRSSQKETAQKRAFFRKLHKSEKGSSFVRWCAAEGLLNGILTSSEMKRAQKGGVLPADYDICHLVPLSLGGTNKTENLCIIQKSLHTALHRKHFMLLEREWDETTHPQAFLHTPTNCFVLTNDDYGLFFEKEEWEKFLSAQEKRSKILAYRQERRKNQKPRPQSACSRKRPENMTEEVIRLENRKYARRQRQKAIILSRKEHRKLARLSATFRDSSKYLQSQIKQERAYFHGRELDD